MDAHGWHRPTDGAHARDVTTHTTHGPLTGQLLSKNRSTYRGCRTPGRRSRAMPIPWLHSPRPPPPITHRPPLTIHRFTHCGGWWSLLIFHQPEVTASTNNDLGWYVRTLVLILSTYHLICRDRPPPRYRAPLTRTHYTGSLTFAAAECSHQTMNEASSMLPKPSGSRIARADARSRGSSRRPSSKHRAANSAESIRSMPYSTRRRKAARAKDCSSSTGAPTIPP